MTEPGLALSRLWGTPSVLRPGPKPRLSLTEIVDASITLARTDGLAAVTMARVAETALCAKMALYRHVSDRDDLLSAMLDRALGEPPQLNGSWRERFTALWDALLGIYASDPWLLELPTDVNGVTPQNLAWIDRALSLFDESLLPSSERLSTVLLITENIRFEARRRKAAGDPVDDLDFLLESAVSAGRRLSGERYPHLAGLSRTGSDGEPASLSSARHVRDLMLRSVAAYFPEGHEG
ncbi:TetR family transcriptional regulator [Rhodococcus sp. AG1013]|uniref:TetR/AcrR family transcriptional regulator n=1 Tax=Rhodococcus sp. AG1013 TaxID=2183996 RepID=UPI000E2ABFE8|nr:helix-turn-helix domain-containing protein [Rhodococcus sp. AG1013]RDI16293.1 TetR family transcriptional regulator [Rhodococcus sp. AG1013]